MPATTYRRWIALSLAHGLLADAERPGGRTAAAMLARAEAVLGERPAWLPLLVAELAGLSEPSWQRLQLSSLAERIERSAAFEEGLQDHAAPRVRRLILRPARTLPLPFALEHLTLPAWPTAADLAAGLQLEPARLAWLINPALAYRDRASPHPVPAQHYRCMLHAKRSGGLRLIEAPKPDLKAAQRQLLAGVLNAVPPHEAAHGFVPGLSVTSHAALHVGQAVVLRFDLLDFFGSIRASRVKALWHTLGYPEGVARSLTALCCTRTPPAVLERMAEAGDMGWMRAKRFAAAHLPQGAPTSPALANLCAFRLDLRLEGLAHRFGARYSRYADDLVLSGPATLVERALQIKAWVAGIVEDEGFFLHPGKTRCHLQHQRQRITGVVVNQKLNVARPDFDRLKARLHQCALHGPADQNHEGVADFRAQLLGQVAWVAQLNAARGAKLKALFERITWPVE